MAKKQFKARNGSSTSADLAKDGTSKRVAKRRSAVKKSNRPNRAALTPEAPVVFVDHNASYLAQRVLILGSNEEVLEFQESNREQLQKSYRKVKRILGKMKPEFRSGKYGVVTGYGVEFYKKRGMVVMPPEYCIMVSVEVKAPPKAVRESMPEVDPFAGRKRKICELPKTFEGIRVKVVEGNCTFAHASPTATSAGGRNDPPSTISTPLKGGVAISMDATNKWGTLGIIFPTKKGTFGMSCKHVVESGVILHPPFKSISATVPRRPIGTVNRKSFLPSAGVDASLVSTTVAQNEGVLDLANVSSSILILVKAHRDNWSQLGNRSVFVRGARTARVVSGIINDTDFSITIDGVDFQHLIKVHATPASASIVERGDSGSALLTLDGTSYVWIGVVVGMINTNELVACRLPACLEKCDLSIADFASNRTWKDLM